MEIIYPVGAGAQLENKNSGNPPSIFEAQAGGGYYETKSNKA